MIRIQPLIDDDGNRNSLASLLSQRYTVVGRDDPDSIDDDADAVIVDDRSLPNHRGEVVSYKQDADPVFVPVVLLQREDTPSTIELPDPQSADDTTVVDDIVSAPVDATVLFQRLSNLLVRREQSLSLAQRYRQTEAEFRGLFQAIPDPAFVVDDDGVVAEANEEFCGLTPEPRSDIVGTDPLDLDVFAATDTDALAAAIEGTGDERAETRFAFEDAGGSERYAELRRREQTVDDTTRTIVVMQDVTDLVKKNQQLEDFASIVTHDLRNPLSVASARLPIVEDRLPENADVDEHLEVIDQSLDRMNDLIEGVRTLVRETGVDDTDPVGLAAVARDAWENVETADATLSIEVSDDVEFLADRQRALQLFENLFRNAREHAGDDAQVELGAFSENAFYVADDGPGIPESERSRVFDSGYTTSQDGTGLGLRIVREIATAHDWGIAVTESESGGARFEITGIRLV
ncbi:PAS domain-containing sensor histidine kinase [Salarchaeum japonicum]|uniref:PAS domain-containing sensor histidine kinase n=1 Tax=Salarchaeum japonicum TaxID=555573 RepID=UPI003C7831C5